MTATTVSATAAAATTTTTTAAITTAPATTTAAAAGTLFARPGDIDVQSAAAQFLAVQCIDGFLGLLGRAHRDEGEPARAACGPVGNQIGFLNGAVRREGVLQVVFGDFEVEVPDE